MDALPNQFIPLKRGLYVASDVCYSYSLLIMHRFRLFVVRLRNDGNVRPKLMSIANSFVDELQSVSDVIAALRQSIEMN